MIGQTMMPHLDVSNVLNSCYLLNCCGVSIIVKKDLNNSFSSPVRSYVQWSVTVLQEGEKKQNKEKVDNGDEEMS